MIFSFENLTLFQRSRELVKEVYQVIHLLPNHETFALGNQLRRAVVSIPSNIAESCGRKSYKDKRRFLEIAYGSLTETYCQLIIAFDLSYISQDTLDKLKPKFQEISKLIAGLSKSYLKQIENSSNAD